MYLYELNFQDAAVYWIAAYSTLEAIQLFRENWNDCDYGSSNELEEELEGCEVTQIEQEEAENKAYLGERFIDGQHHKYTCSMWAQFCMITEPTIIACSEW